LPIPCRDPALDFGRRLLPFLVGSYSLEARSQSTVQRSLSFKAALVDPLSRPVFWGDLPPRTIQYAYRSLRPPTNSVCRFHATDRVGRLVPCRFGRCVIPIPTFSYRRRSRPTTVGRAALCTRRFNLVALWRRHWDTLC
jgi:hypothetical protein